LKKLKAKINTTFNTKSKKRILENIISLSFLQMISYIYPLITFPYLIKTLTIEVYGLLAFALAMIGYFSIFTDFGLNLTMTKKIALYRNDRNKLIELLSSGISIKFILAIFSFIILNIIVFSFDKFSNNWLIHLLYFGIVINQVVYPYWLFQGIEKTKYITILSFIFKTLYVVLIFSFITTPDDAISLPIILFTVGFLEGLVSLFIIFVLLKLEFKIQSFERIKYYMKKSYYIFISNVSINLSSTTTIFLLGILTNNTIVGYYAAAEKLIFAAKGLITPITYSIFPYLSKLSKKSKKYSLLIIRKISLFLIIFTTIASIFGVITAKYILEFLIGNQHQESIIILQILSFTILTSSLINMFGVQTMLTFGRNRAYSKILMIGAFMNLLLNFILIPKFQHIGAALSVLIVEILIVLMMFIYIKKRII